VSVLSKTARAHKKEKTDGKRIQFRRQGELFIPRNPLSEDEARRALQEASKKRRAERPLEASSLDKIAAASRSSARLSNVHTR
jgi:hypothetical protein